MKPDVNHSGLTEAPLGKKSPYINTYTPSLLFPVSRQPKRDEIGIGAKLPFSGVDIWNGFELSWLNPKGKPVVATAEFRIPCESPFIVESKSFKLYLNSLNNSRFGSFEEVRKILERDISQCTGSKVIAGIHPMSEGLPAMGVFDGKCLDSLDIECSDYMPKPELLRTGTQVIEETVYSDLLKSNCLVTGQPDWGTIRISYRGHQIEHEGLLKYIVSLRDHNEFHEQCVERIFCDLMKICKPQWLSVYARYTRRGGLDINPFRKTLGTPGEPENIRLLRQ